MPKQVNHDQRRIEIVEATWRIIAKGGFAAATMREIAAEAGFANGGLKHYFASKDDLLAAAFERTFYRINERAARSIGTTTGLDAIRLLCLEMLPLDAERSIEARVTIAFWDRAGTSPKLSKIHADSYAIWRKWMENELGQARLDGQVVSPVPDGQIIDEFLSLATGLRVIPLLDSEKTLSESHVFLLDAAVDRLRSGTPEPASLPS